MVPDVSEEEQLHGRLNDKPLRLERSALREAQASSRTAPADDPELAGPAQWKCADGEGDGDLDLLVGVGDYDFPASHARLKA
jgi:hypothetical protein